MKNLYETAFRAHFIENGSHTHQIYQNIKKRHYDIYFIKPACSVRIGECWRHVFIFRCMNFVCGSVHKPGITEDGPVWLCIYKPTT